jgi:predicted kinase
MKLELVCGPSGSGKTTYGKNNTRPGTSVLIEADEFFVLDGTYHFDSNNLSMAHEECLERTQKAMRDQIQHVIVCNTFVKRWEMYPYVKLMVQHPEYTLVVTEAKAAASDKFEAVDILMSRNVHNVSRETIERQIKTYEYRKTSTWDSADIARFITMHNPDIVVNPYMGINVDRTKTLTQGGKLLVDLVEQTADLDFAILAEASNNVKDRNVRGKPSQLHLTVASALEMRGLTKEDIQYFLLAASTVDIDIVGAGLVRDGANVSFYLVPSDACIAPMRDFRIKVGLSAAFFPHITVGFIGSDIHGVPKSANVIQTNSHHREDIVRLCKCFLHVDVFIVVRPMGPEAILGLGRLLDLRVRSGFMGDDATYAADWDVLVDLVWRGQSHWGSTGECVLRGTRKFTGTPGNDDDYTKEPTGSELAFKRAKLECTHFFEGKKLNGRNGIFAFLIHKSRIWCVGGTKLSHTCARYNEDTQTFDLDHLTDPKDYMVARNFLALEAALVTVQDLSSFFNAVLGYSIVCEVEDGQEQHIEPLPQTRMALQCFVVSSPNVRNNANKLDEIRSLGFPTVHKTKYVITALPQRIRAAKNARTEGVVFELSDKWNTIQDQRKEKSVWYVVLRAIREATKTALFSNKANSCDHLRRKLASLTMSIEKTKEKTKLYEQILNVERDISSLYTRLATDAIVRLRSKWMTKFGFLRGDVNRYDEQKVEYFALLSSFLAWLGQKLDMRELVYYNTKTFTANFPTVWTTFLKANVAHVAKEAAIFPGL